MTTGRYASLSLTDNPFPSVPTMDPSSSDIRMNGSIYDEDISGPQLAALRQKLDRRENLIYAQNTKFVTGVGKSALIAQEWRRLQRDSLASTAYIRCGRKTQADTVDGACSTIIDTWCQTGVLWKAFCGILTRYCKEALRSQIDRGIVDTLIANHPTQPRSLSPRALMIYDIHAIVDAILAWLEDTAPRLWSDIAKVYLTTMLSAPPNFPELYKKRVKKREVTGFLTMVDLILLGGVPYPYIFLDQFEDLFHGRGKKELHDLASSMRQILEVCSGRITFVVTLHPSASMGLSSMDSQSLTTIAPLDGRHVVELPNIEPKQAVHLAATYLSRFRASAPASGDALAPFNAQCVEQICGERDGNIRQILQTLYYCIEVAVDAGSSLIDSAFLQSHHREITGKVSDKELEL